MESRNGEIVKRKNNLIHTWKETQVKSRSMSRDINLEFSTMLFLVPRILFSALRGEKYYLKKYFVPTITEIYLESS